MSHADPRLRAMLRLAPVIPVYTPDSVEQAVAVAGALLEGGLPVIEVTLRTPVALEAIAAMVQAVPDAVVGAGTVLTGDDLARSIDAGAEFIVSPGLTPSLGHAAIREGVPFLPGIANAGDIMRGLDLGLTHFKFFPAEASGGLKALKALAAPFHHARFCPTGGITQASAPDWLAEPAILCVGGSWLVGKGAPDSAAIRAAAQAASALKA